MKIAIRLTGFGIATAIFCLPAQVSPGSSPSTSVPYSSAAPPASAYRITTYAGGTFAGDGGPSTSALLGSVDGLASDPQGNLYLADSANHRIRMVQPGGRITTIAGDGTPGFSGDTSAALLARFKSPYGLAADHFGNLFIADFGNGRVRKIARDGRITTVASGLAGPRNLVTDLTGNLYISDAPANRVYMYSTTGKLNLLAGDGTAIPLKFPAGLAVDYLGTLFIADTGTQSILRLAAGKAELLTTQPALPGTPLALASDYYGRLLIATSEGGLFSRNLDGALTPLLPNHNFKTIRALHQDLAGNVYFSEPNRVWRLSGLGAAAIVAGLDESTPSAPATPAEARLTSPMGLALDPTGNLYFADEQTRRVWRINSSGSLQPVAGTGVAPASPMAAGDGGPAASAPLFDPVAVAVSPYGEIAIAEFDAHRVRVILPNGVIFTAAGTGTPGLEGDNGPAQFAQLNKPRGLAYDTAGNLYIADSGNGLVRKLGRNGFLNTVGNTTGAAVLDNPTSVTVDPAGQLFVAESGAHTVRRLNAANIWEPISAGPLNLPTGLSFDATGHLYIADVYNHRIRRVAPAGIVETIAGTGAAAMSGDGGAALQAALNSPVAAAVDSQGRVFIADLENRRIRLLTPDAVPPPAFVDPPPPAQPPPAHSESALKVLHSATLKEGPYAPGQLVSLFGEGLAQAAEVRVNGQPIALSYASTTQFNFQLPYITTPDAVIEVVAAGTTVAHITIPLSPAAPGLFGPLAPAPRGSIAAFYATGAGLLDPAGKPLHPVSLQIGNVPVDLLYVGEAPGVPGVLQLNAQLPGLFTAPGEHPVTLTIGANSSPAGTTIKLQ